jgi:nucleotide-binding universal stress UspA family protein
MFFRRVLVGFDGSPAAKRALAQASALRAEDGALVALTVAETYRATHAGMDAVSWDAAIRADAERARRAAEAQLGGRADTSAELCSGHAASAILRRADAMDADLIAVGTHGHGRISGILLGSVATRVVHEARRVILIARGDAPLAHFPSSIIVGVDDSPASAEAARVAAAVAASTGAAVAQLTAAGRPRVDALLEASRNADLLVIGTRGLHGLHAFASVAERVAHEAACPVLIAPKT